MLSGKETLVSFKREHMAPGEMEHILIPTDLLGKAGEDLTVTAEGREQQ